MVQLFNPYAYGSYHTRTVKIRVWYITQITVSTYPEETLLQSIQAHQSKDREIVDIINYLILPTDSKEAKHIVAITKKGYFVLDGILYYESSEVPGRRHLVHSSSKT